MAAEDTGVWWWSSPPWTRLCSQAHHLDLLFVRAFGLYRRQAAALMAALVPIAADSLYTYGLVGSEDVNLAPASFAWVGLVLYLGFTRYQLMDVTPVAREFVVEHLAAASW